MSFEDGGVISLHGRRSSSLFMDGLFGGDRSSRPAFVQYVTGSYGSSVTSSLELPSEVRLEGGFQVFSSVLFLATSTDSFPLLQE